MNEHKCGIHGAFAFAQDPTCQVKLFQGAVEPQGVRQQLYLRVFKFASFTLLKDDVYQHDGRRVHVVQGVLCNNTCDAEVSHRTCPEDG